MAILNTLYTYLEHLESKKFYRYLAILLSFVLLGMLIIFFRYYSKVRYYKRSAANINELREEARIIREKFQQVQTQRAAVNAMLAEDPNFKIGGYFNTVLSKLSLTEKKSSEETTQIDREDNYRESELTAQLISINMKQLTELLYEIEQKKRIYIKRLEIEKSKKKQNSIEAILTIATLLPRTEEVGTL